ncbi:N-(5'-phosphoribosyl)anthranilate isomerase [Falseniella ignava]|uniref:N-(5'-phosphoribosyl)anthranilate isomerase n=1 Tax=Falseniella ignava TaxID=137730 RepID=A0A2I1JXY4_9LACT|nr:N-(5'-phosphoribosyl)anthranilate isomerase [Falseniella ignava]
MPKQYIIMEDLGYELIDLHEHEFQKNGLSVEYGSIDFLYDFAGIRVSDLDIIQVDGITFRLPNLRQFLKIYQASSKDSYRNDNNNNKDFKKIDFLKKHI